VLTEMATTGMRIEQVIVGVGLNVGATELPEPLRAIATSLARATATVPDRAEVAGELIVALRGRYQAFVGEGVAATVHAWKREVDFLGARVTVTSGTEKVSGIAEDVDDEGALRVRDARGVAHRLWAGDVVVVER
jgi:BirA family biotin operon repressor/biotin-[acetyl-CoA-carboxylase] ligase